MDEIKPPARGSILSDEQAMDLALRLAHNGAGFVSPNPLVGCVILDEKSRYLESGFHAIYGQDHAEAMALNKLQKEFSPEQLADRLGGARVFVTLEPCSHEGKTPSCARALAKWKLAEVHYGLVDPNPLVSGQGALILERAGIHTVLWPSHHREKLETTCEHFLFNLKHKKSFVSLKVASSLDGIMALRSGESQWITGSESRNYGQFLRGCHDGLLVGAKTVLLDNPRLTLRHPRFQNRPKALKLLIMDPQGSLLTRPDLRIFSSHSAENIMILVKPELARHDMKQAQLVSLPGTMEPHGSWIPNLNETLINLHSLGIYSILVEGGAQTISSFISAGEAQRLYLFQAPVIIGAGSGLAWSDQVKMKSLAEKISLRGVERLNFGDDQLITGLFVNNGTLEGLKLNKNVYE